MSSSFRVALVTACVAAAGWVPAVRAQPSFFATLPTDTAIGYLITDGAPRSGYRPHDRQLAIWALEAWARASNNVLRFAPVASDPTIRVEWIAAGQGEYGEMRPSIVDGRRRATVFIHPDPDALGDDIAAAARKDPLLRDTIVYLTCLHELGHAIGLEHTAAYADIMYAFGYGGDVPRYFGRYRERLASTEAIANVSGLSRDDVRRVRALYPVRSDRR